jgi:geranylgeranyl diphosphate synthase type I
VVAALSSEIPAAAELAELLARPETLSEEDLLRASDLVVEAGGRQWAEDEADSQLAAANQCLADIDLPGDVHREFTAIAEFITARQW